MIELPISFDDVARAHERIAGAVHRTPVLTSTTANARTGAQMFFKCENLQRTGAFKMRGAYNALAQFTVEQRALRRRHVFVGQSRARHCAGREAARH